MTTTGRCATDVNDVAMTSQRTQMYLDSEDHQRLRRLAAERGASITALVREADGRYLVEEGATALPPVEELAETSGGPRVIRAARSEPQGWWSACGDGKKRPGMNRPLPPLRTGRWA